MISKQLSSIVQNYYLNGRLDEDFVMDAVKHTLGGDITRASKEEDMYKHIDFWWNSPKKGKIGIDVKGIKKNNRNDNNYDDSIHWLELTNVNGKSGWLYGKADYIAFRTNSSIIFCKRQKLLNFILSKIKDKKIIHNNPRECYISYQRYNRQDIIVKALTTDIENIADFSIVF